MSNYVLHEGDCLNVLRGMADKSVDHVICDPPYSERTHSGVRGHARRTLKGGNGKASARVIDLGFSSLMPGEVGALCGLFASVARRWVLVFCDTDLAPVWRSKGKRAGLQYVQTCVWDRIGGAPQFDGLGPASPVEYVIAFHARNGTRRRWNGGGKRGIYSFPVVANRLGQQGSRVHPTQKPQELMVALMEDFTDPGETILDPFAGSGTTGVAALRLGRKFIGCELDPKYAALARERLAAEEQGSTLAAARAGQIPMFGDLKKASSK